MQVVHSAERRDVGITLAPGTLAERRHRDPVCWGGTKVHGSRFRYVLEEMGKEMLWRKLNFELLKIICGDNKMSEK